MLAKTKGLLWCRRRIQTIYDGQTKQIFGEKSMKKSRVAELSRVRNFQGKNYNGSIILSRTVIAQGGINRYLRPRIFRFAPFPPVQFGFWYQIQRVALPFKWNATPVLAWFSWWVQTPSLKLISLHFSLARKSRGKINGVATGKKGAGKTCVKRSENNDCVLLID